MIQIKQDTKIKLEKIMYKQKINNNALINRI